MAKNRTELVAEVADKAGTSQAAVNGVLDALFQVFESSVAQGEKIPRKGGQGMIKSDFFIINKTDLAPYVGASLDQMAKDTEVFRGNHPFAFTNLKTDEGLEKVIEWIEHDVLLKGLT